MHQGTLRPVTRVAATLLCCDCLRINDWPCQVEFIGNTASFLGGALLIPSTTTLSHVTFINNTADIGGAMFVGGTATIGRLCATNNTAFTAGGFAVVDEVGSLVFGDPGNATLGNHRPYTIQVAPGATVSSTGTPGRWPAGNYSLTGPVDACTVRFANGQGKVCNGCGVGKAWDGASCNCTEVRGDGEGGGTVRRDG